MAEDKGLSLLDYARKQKPCVVCDLPDAVRVQMVNASAKKIKRVTVLAWLKDQHTITLANADLTRHAAGHHDQRRDS